MAMKRRRAEEDASHCQSWKKQMIKRFNDDQNLKLGFAPTLKDLKIPADSASREKALRAAMLKTRFADTILKATEALFPDKKSDLSRKIEREKELKKRREREREALEEMEKRAEVDRTAATLKMWFGPTGYPSPRTLQRLGLHIIGHREEEGIYAA